MPRLYIFAIGGTGSRVIKSLTMLLASGVKANNNFEIVPIIIDPHKSNKDLERTTRLLRNYQAVIRKVGIDTGFFSTSISTLDNLDKNNINISSNFTFDLQEVTDAKFRDYIAFNTLDDVNQKLIDILFSGKSINKNQQVVDLLDIEMNIGFVGNPNIGSVVLNQFKDSEEFRTFANNFHRDDRVFIISSIFGGTGAAGFPTILKNIRDAINIENINAKGDLTNSKIGAITVLPYFNLSNDLSSPIKQSDFISKTKSALQYYKGNVNKSLNTLYYIGDDSSDRLPYLNDPGNNGQKNKAHFVELASALAVIDFMNINDEELITIDGKVQNPIFKEFFIKSIENDSAIKFSNLEDDTADLITLKLSQFTLFLKYIEEGMLKESLEKESWTNETPLINKGFLTNYFYRTNIVEFKDYYFEWLKELEENKISFKPFNLSATIDVLINDYQGKYGKIFKSNFNFIEFNNILNKVSHKDKNIRKESPEARFLSLFYNTTNEILKEIYKIK